MQGLKYPRDLYQNILRDFSTSQRLSFASINTKLVISSFLYHYITHNYRKRYLYIFITRLNNRYINSAARSEGYTISGILNNVIRSQDSATGNAYYINKEIKIENNNIYSNKNIYTHSWHITL